MRELTEDRGCSGSLQLTSPVRFMTLGISKVSEHETCVAAIMEDGSWVRPESPSMADIKMSNSPFAYFQWASASLGESIENNPRPEDHHILEFPCKEDSLSEGQLEFLCRHQDPSAEDAFSGERSLGLIQANIQRLFIKQSTGGRNFLRTEFTDAKQHSYDWIITEIRFPELLAPLLVNGQITTELNEKLLHVFQTSETFFTIALTKPNNRFPGKFRGCHPVIVGIHTVPDYRQRLNEIS